MEPIDEEVKMLVGKLMEQVTVNLLGYGWVFCWMNISFPNWSFVSPRWILLGPDQDPSFQVYRAFLSKLCKLRDSQYSITVASTRS
jgi:hypothetical protein